MDAIEEIKRQSVIAAIGCKDDLLKAHEATIKAKEKQIAKLRAALELISCQTKNHIYDIAREALREVGEAQ